MQTTTCDKCGCEIEHGQWPFCPHPGYRRHNFVPVEVDLGSLGKHMVGSIQDADRLEKMSKAHGKEIAFRAFHNNPSNQDAWAMGQPPSQERPQTRNARGKPYISIRKSRDPR